MTRRVVYRYTSDMTVNHYQYLVSSIEDVMANENIIVHVVKGSSAEDYFMVPKLYSLKLGANRTFFILQNSNDTIARMISGQLRRYPARRHSLKDLNDLSNIVQGNHILILVIKLFD